MGKARSQEIDVYRYLLEHAPKAKPGRRPSNESASAANPWSLPRGKNHAKSASVLEVRLVQERPEYFDAYRRGEYKSVTAAATAAGLVQNDADLRRTKSGFGKLTDLQCVEFFEWMRQHHPQKFQLLKTI